MTGLIEKDIRLILQRKQALVIFLFIAVVFGFTMEGTFIMGYLPFLCVILAIGTISYDEFENGFAFLMTLPIDRKTYVLEKYVFCFMAGVIGWVLASVIYFTVLFVHGSQIAIFEDLIMNTSFLFVFSIILAIMIPIQLKFGIEKSRIAMMFVAGMVMAIAFLISSTNANSLSRFVQYLDSLNQYMVLGVFCVISVICTLISYFASCHIMKNKEF